MRRLAAVLAADVAGFSRLMGGDEEGTLEQLNAHTAAPSYQRTGASGFVSASISATSSSRATISLATG
jgi:hypothetical protein